MVPRQGSLPPRLLLGDIALFPISSLSICRRSEPIMDRQVGVLRDRAGLQDAIGRLRALMRNGSAADGPAAAMVGLMIAVSAYHRNESRGAHQRLDYPDLRPEQHTEITLDQALRLAAEIDETAAPVRRVA